MCPLSSSLPIKYVIAKNGKMATCNLCSGLPIRRRLSFGREKQPINNNHHNKMSPLNEHSSKNRSKKAICHRPNSSSHQQSFFKYLILTAQLLLLWSASSIVVVQCKCSRIFFMMHSFWWIEHQLNSLKVCESMKNWLTCVCLCLFQDVPRKIMTK